MSTWKLKKKCDLGDIKRIKGETHTIFNFNSPFLFLSRYKCLWRVCLCILSDQASFSLIFFPQMNLAKVKKWVISIPFSLLSEPKMRQSLRFKPQGSLMNNVDSRLPGGPALAFHTSEKFTGSELISIAGSLLMCICRSTLCKGTVFEEKDIFLKLLEMSL